MENIQRSRSASPPGRSDGCRGLVDKSGLSGVEGAVQYGQNASTWMGVIDGSAKDETVGRFGFCDDLVDDVAIKDTPAG